jgi:acetylornithine deacetylase/succinyl-diaminopimelate desuccinylase-like protein
MTNTPAAAAPFHIETYCAEHNQRFTDELLEFLTFASVSTAPEHAADVASCAQWLAAKLSELGFVVQVHPTAGHPIVTAQFVAGPHLPTVLMYGHYDVQPVDPLHLWTSPPFLPRIDNDVVYARGATDDKGQVYAHVKALEAILATTGTLPCNVTMLIEGEEEIGSPHLAPFITANKELLRCDCVVVSDTPMFAPGQPAIVVGLRGLAYMEITVRAANRDLHSGSYGGAIPNPLNELANILASLKAADNRVAIDGFYDEVLDRSPEERLQIAKLGSADNRLLADTQVPELSGEAGYTSLERLWIRPTLDINGMVGGFTGTGAKTVLPATATAKVSMRLVPNQDHNTIAMLFTKYVQKIASSAVTVTVTDLHGANPVLVDSHNPYIAAAVSAMEHVYQHPCVFTHEGGSIPVVLTFSELLGAPTILMGFGLSTENAHSPDEHFSLHNYRKGMLAAAQFYRNVATAQ